MFFPLGERDEVEGARQKSKVLKVHSFKFHCGLITYNSLQSYLAFFRVVIRLPCQVLIPIKGGDLTN